MGDTSDIRVSEHRRFPRYPCKGAVEILNGGRRWGWGRVNEISRGGCYVATIYPLPVDSEAQVRLTIAGTSLEIYANVVSTDPLVGMGLAFVPETREQWNQLGQILDRVIVAETVPATEAPPFELQAGANFADQARSPVLAALQYLQQAKQELQAGMPDNEGHRSGALQWTEHAISEVMKGLEAAERQPERMKAASRKSGVV